MKDEDNIHFEGNDEGDIETEYWVWDPRTGSRKTARMWVRFSPEEAAQKEAEDDHAYESFDERTYIVENESCERFECDVHVEYEPSFYAQKATKIS